jgi:hypothetical protein
MPTGRQTDMKPTVAFRNFGNSPTTVKSNIWDVKTTIWCSNNNLRVGCEGKEINGYEVLVGKPGGKGALGRPSRRCQDNIKMGLKINRKGAWTVLIRRGVVCINL